MTISDILSISFNNLRRNIFRSILTILGVAVGVGALSTMISLGRGVSMNIAKQMGTNDLFTGMTVSGRDLDMDYVNSRRSILTPKDENIVPLTDSTIADLKRMPEVAMVFPEIIKPASIQFRGKKINTNLKAVPCEMGVFHPFDNIKIGTFYKTDSDPCVIISKNVLHQLGFALPNEDLEHISEHSLTVIPVDSVIGQDLDVITTVFDPEKIDLLTSTSKQLPIKNEVTNLKIKGIVETNSFSSGMFSGGIFLPPLTCEWVPSIDLNYVYNLMNDTQDKYGKYASIHVRVKDHSLLKKAKFDIEDKGFHVFSIGDKLDDLERLFYILDSALAAIGIIALLISVFGIVNTLIMAIYERRKEIGIMKSLGATQWQIKQIFYYEAASIGTIGGIVGVIGGKIISEIASNIANHHLGTFIDSNIEYFSYSLSIVGISIVFSIIVSIIASIYPANKASKIDPLDALRRE